MLDELIAHAPADDDEEGPTMKSFISSGHRLQAAVKAARTTRRSSPIRIRTTASTWCPASCAVSSAVLRLLHGVPFSYLVPDAELLPVESIRFFYLDRAWTDALVQGALSVVTPSAAPTARSSRPSTRTSATRSIEAERTIRQPRGEKRCSKAGSSAPSPASDALARAVSGWPNLRAHLRATVMVD